MARGSRITVHPNIYRDDLGFEIIVRRRGETGRARYLGHHYTLDYLLDERQRITDELEKAVAIVRGTFAADVAAMLKTLPAGVYRENRRRECQAWLDAGFGTKRRQAITAAHITTQCSVWASSGIAASTINHRLTGLRAVYKFHDHEPGPCATVKRHKERRDVRAIPQAAVEAVLMQLALERISPTKRTRILIPNSARLMVMARTGLPPEQIRRLKPTDVDLVKRTMFIGSRKKGAGVPGRSLPLTHAAVRAFEAMHATKAWGKFSTASMFHHFVRARERAQAAWCQHCGRWPAPENFHPYDLRHAFLTEVYRRTRDLRVTAELGLHADMTMTALYAQAAVTETANAARDILDGMAPFTSTMNTER
jgi:integrase